MGFLAVATETQATCVSNTDNIKEALELQSPSVQFNHSVPWITPADQKMGNIQ